MDRDHMQPLEADLDAAVARTALEHGDWPQAACHIAGAVGHDPGRSDFVALLEALADAVGVDEALALFPLDGRPWYGTAAVHAWLLARRGDVDDALELLCQVACVKPDLPWLTWAPAWVDRQDPDPERVYLSVAQLIRCECRDGCAQARSLWGPATDVVTRVCDLHPEHAELLSLGAIAARRAGRFDDALVLAERGFDAAPSWMSAVALANAHRALGHTEQTEAAWAAALRHDADDLGVRLDWGDFLLDRGDLEDARQRYQEVLDRVPGHPWATASLRYIAWALDPTPEGRLDLVDQAEADPDNERLGQLAELATPWVGYLPVLPLASRAADTRGDDAPPDEAVHAAVGELAATPFHSVTWLEEGAAIARALGADAVEALVGTAAHPPAPPDDADADGWRYRVQHAVAFVLAGGAQTLQRCPFGEALRAAAASSDAGFVTGACGALAEWGRAGPAAREEAIAVLCAVHDAASHGAGAVAWPAACALWRIGLSPASRVALRPQLVSLEQRA